MDKIKESLMVNGHRSIVKSSQQARIRVLQAKIAGLDYQLLKEKLLQLHTQRSDSLDRMILSVVDPQVVREFPPYQQYQIAPLLGDLAKRWYLYDWAHNYYELAYLASKSINLPPEQQVDALIELHNSTWQNDLQESLGLLQKALEICKQHPIALSRLPTVLYELGFTHRRLQELDKAIDFYEQAREACRNQAELDLPRLATILNDLAFAIYQHGDHKALSEIYLKRALKYRQKILVEAEKKDDTKEIENANLFVGMTFNTSGEIYRYKNYFRTAIEYYSEAIKHFRVVENIEWQIRALTGRGEAQRRLAAQKQDYLSEESQQHAQQAMEDADAAVQLCEQYPTLKGRDTVYRRKGRLLHDMALTLKTTDHTQVRALLEESRQYFEKALAFAQQSDDFLEQLENLTEIVFLGDDLLEVTSVSEHASLETSQREAVQRLSALIQSSPPLHQLPVFKSLLQMEEAAYYFVQGEYDQAMHGYLEAFSTLAMDPGYGATRYHAHLDHLKNHISKLPTSVLVERWCNEFIEKWKTTKQKYTDSTLADVYPDLVDWCEEYSDLFSRGQKIS